MQWRSSNRFIGWIRSVHLVLGLTSGIVIFIVSVSGAICVFQNEIRDLVHPYRTIANENKPWLAPSALTQPALKLYPKGSLYRVTLFTKSRPAAIVIKSGQAFYTVYVNPFSGKVMHQEKTDSDFFVTVQHLHTHLLLPTNIGTAIVDTAVVIFIGMLITGLLLWWPRNRAQRRKSFVISIGGTPGLLYHLHKVLGFYILIAGFIISITGLSMRYPLLRNSLSKAVNFGRSYESEKEKFPVSDTSQQRILSANELLDGSILQAQRLNSHAQMFTAYLPFGSNGVMSISGYGKPMHSYNRSDFYFDQFSGALIKSLYHNKKSAGSKLSSLNYDLHTGQALGLPGKIIAFLASLVCASLPITGFLIWRAKVKM